AKNVSPTSVLRMHERASRFGSAAAKAAAASPARWLPHARNAHQPASSTTPHPTARFTRRAGVSSRAGGTPESYRRAEPIFQWSLLLAAATSDGYGGRSPSTSGRAQSSFKSGGSSWLSRKAPVTQYEEPAARGTPSSNGGPVGGEDRLPCHPNPATRAR